MEWIKTRAETAVEALTAKRVLVVSFVFAVGTAADKLADFVIRKAGVALFLDLPAWVVGVLAALVTIIYFLFEYAHRLYREKKPRLEITFPHAGLGIVEAVDRQPMIVGNQLQYGPEIRSTYVRIQIDTLSSLTVRDCVVGVTGLEFRPHGAQNFARV